MFSVVIPTRARADTLRHALRTVVAQSEQDLEIVVHESGDDPATAAVLAEFDDRRIRAFKTGEPVPMPENWELALRRTSGKYIFFMGDDDGLFPHACSVARQILGVHSAEILSCPLATYFWPDFFDPRLRDRMIFVYGTDLECTLKDSRTALHLACRFQRHFTELPMIYNNSFVARTLIERVYKSQPRYFVGSNPDIVSGIMNLFFSKTFLRCNRSLSVSGISRHSTGAATGYSGNAKMQSAAISAYGGIRRIKIHPTMVQSYNLTLGIGNDLLAVKDALFPDAKPELDYAAMLQQAMQNLSQATEQYELELAQCQTVAAKNGISLNEEGVPPQRLQLSPPPIGRREIAPGVVVHTLDGQPAGVRNVFDATVVLNELLPQPVDNGVKIASELAQVQAIDLGSANPTELNLSAAGNGALLLRIGWSTAESWGVWSIASRSELIFPVTGYFRGRLKITVHGQIFCLPRMLRLRIQQGSQALVERELHLTNEAVTFDIFPIELRTDKPADELRVVFAIDRCVSPAELGLSEYKRKLGFGLRSIEVAAVREPPVG